MNRILTACAAAALLACSPRAEESAPRPSPEAAAQAPSDIPAGLYKLDPSHSTLIFRVNHIGFSIYTASFSRFDAVLEIDPEDPESGRLQATVDVSSLILPAPPPGFHKILMGPEWFAAGAHPEMTFESTGIERTGENTARIDGVLTMRGASQPVSLEATFNGGYPGMAELDPQARAGFSARGTLSRSAFGMDIGLPPPGTTMGVGDEVEIIIETEFLGPPLAAAPGEE